MNCKEARKILNIRFKLWEEMRSSRPVYLATRHLLKCNSCFTWSLEECELIRETFRKAIL